MIIFLTPKQTIYFSQLFVQLCWNSVWLVFVFRISVCGYLAIYDDYLLDPIHWPMETWAWFWINCWKLELYFLSLSLQARCFLLLCLWLLEAVICFFWFGSWYLFVNIDRLCSLFNLDPHLRKLPLKHTTCTTKFIPISCGIIINRRFKIIRLIPCHRFNQHFKIFINLFPTVYFSKASRIILIKFSQNRIEFVVLRNLIIEGRKKYIFI